MQNHIRFGWLLRENAKQGEEEKQTYTPQIQTPPMLPIEE